MVSICYLFVIDSESFVYYTSSSEGPSYDDNTLDDISDIPADEDQDAWRANLLRIMDDSGAYTGENSELLSQIWRMHRRALGDAFRPEDSEESESLTPEYSSRFTQSSETRDTTDSVPSTSSEETQSLWKKDLLRIIGDSSESTDEICNTAFLWDVKKMLEEPGNQRLNNRAAKTQVENQRNRVAPVECVTNVKKTGPKPKAPLKTGKSNETPSNY
ncbi:hypothetical protein EB796_007728 [Bugula neritina]|uniref:Uncharacterized protein n=1 Tax=Bugula neritina TaxID=10212 RepID=A0A7J7K7N1_BUGNE|nr:hypothetical protein EB796_007728 [Bugula neritina]